MPITFFASGGDGDGKRFTFTAETDADLLAGQALLVKSTGHLGLAQADAPAQSAVAGLAIADTTTGFAVTYASAGQLILSDWTAIIGQAWLAPGATYFLDPITPGGMTVIPPHLAGDVAVALGEAVSTTTFNIHIQSPILL